jgi:hypothetical protein
MPISVTDSNGLTTSHSGTPAVGSYQTNWGAAATPITPASNDLAGAVSVLSGGSAPAAGNVATVTFAQPFASPPKSVSLDGPLSAYPTAITNTGFTIVTGAAGVAATTYTWYYIVVA